MSSFGAYSRYYDLLYKSKHYTSEIKYILRIIERHAPGARTLLDLGCGTGIHACGFARAGYRVTGVDRSEEMLEEARRRVKREVEPGGFGSVELVCDDIRDFRSSQRFNIVTALFHVISYLPTNNDLDAAFSRIGEYLQPGGLLIFDHWYGPAVLTDRPVTRVKHFENEETKIVRVATPTLHLRDNLVDVRYDITVTDKASGGSEQLSEDHIMRYLFWPEVESLLLRHQLKPTSFAEWLSDRVPDETSWNTIVVAHSERCSAPEPQFPHGFTKKETL